MLKVKKETNQRKSKERQNRNVRAACPVGSPWG
jgi:hypothetical protein